VRELLARVVVCIVVCISGVLSAGCQVTSKDRSKQLERVAKDWCLTIRASQVIPTYPLTEDLLPGDVFLTSTPIGDEVAEFEERGFLPLDNHLVRLPADAVFPQIEGFYAAKYDVDNKNFPRKLGWDQIPDAKFPSYTFQISKSGGLNLAIPVQGVPVGFNYLGAAKATGSVTISEAKTLGLDIHRLNPLVTDWAEKNQALLKSYGTFPDDPNATPVFVRVVSRIYYTGKVNVYLADATTNAAEAKAGFDLPLSLLSADQTGKTTAERQQEAVDRLNVSLLKDKQIGAKVKIVSATSRSISMDEEFARPVVIGYLAFDRQINWDGTLGPPVSTLVKVSGRKGLTPRIADVDSSGYITAWYTRDQAARAKLIDQWLAKHYPSVAMSTFISQDEYEEGRLRMIRDLGMD
jgi:hypothetical protein